ncbi:MAG: FimB/Mfa2 family fimbrial subunit [Muribaculaceae bacterium]|nr:FimB/Mfa2 family fimbrial subunit [Muribaculaceae bacterium]
MKLSNFFTNPYRWLAAASLITVLSGCNNGFVYEDLAECRPDRRVRLSFTRNMAFEEKRQEEVTHAKVFAFDDEGLLADFNVSEGQNLINNDYTIPLNLEQDVNYRFITWCGSDQDAFAINADPTETMSRTDGDLDGAGSDIMEGLGATVANENGIIKTELDPIHYGNGAHAFTKMTGTEEYTIDLTKDTNTIIVYLRKVLNMNGLEVYIEDKNDELDFNNGIANEDVHIKYYPVSVETNVDCPTGDGNGGYTGEYVKGTKLVFNTSRLFDPADVGNTSNLARIVINETRPDGSKSSVLNEPLVRDILIKSKPNVMAPDGEHWTRKSDQEYLDREDTYEAVFTLEDYAMIVVHINGWRVVIQPVNIGQ